MAQLMLFFNNYLLIFSYNFINCLFNIKLVEKFREANFIDFEINHINDNNFLKTLCNGDDLNTNFLISPNNFKCQSIDDILKIFISKEYNYVIT